MEWWEKEKAKWLAQRKKRHLFHKRKLVDELCYILQPGDLSIFSVKEKKRRREKKGERRKNCWETFVFDTARWLNIAGTLKRKEKRKRNLFLKSYLYLFGRRLLKLCSILNAPLCWNLLVVLFSIELPSFAHICFSFVSFSLILAKCLIHLKTLSGNFWKFDNS